ncbi:TerB family tellurite resistance protein [Maribacter algarum]|uniref:TerB family tellurite resistance protein n=1 Tax=Maribacter algarum (ex Zhang et al. 2020) TaxID=2578118 RepID=A0A5S3PU23_9FLAO|nr:TerB family tellurite resistance protein [Maribacter algarum]TMM58485.1 TerB family tellurite resistance protein [Maribacter algarum]
MTLSTIGFSLAEKLAIVKALDSLILADGHVHNAEITMMSSLMSYLDFDSNFLVQARNLTIIRSNIVLDKMSREKKIVLAQILKDMAKVDGFVHKKETEVISNFCKEIKI